MKELPIGIIDSGFGGLTVVKQCLKQLPNESVLYLGDSARAPYGPRPLAEVRKFIWQLTYFLREKGIKMLVIACNTGTAAALYELKMTLPIPVLGVIDAGSRAAIKHTNNNHIGVIGTEGTIHSGQYTKTLLAKDARLQVYSHAVPRFVSIVEENRVEAPQTYHQVKEDLSYFEDKDIDTLVLGCTHYPHLKDTIQKAVGPNIKLIDSGVETINEVSTILDYFNLSRSAADLADYGVHHQIYTTGDPERFARFARNWLEDPYLTVKQARIKGEMIIEDTDSQL
ncbi:glutamate racemase [Ignavigranum ruoffiae]|uniref:Glutamate racemase n=1 Tax=Ignavigranum ruoffiae TaxID=89093 RepID=A0A1H9A102_9LACT|nr:glutamate racemase [Ignavigranum ruoffiae]SEP70285.1 glutamate racemase [Ignavigranum ruoffiae]